MTEDQKIFSWWFIVLPVLLVIVGTEVYLWLTGTSTGLIPKDTATQIYLIAAAIILILLAVIFVWFFKKKDKAVFRPNRQTFISLGPVFFILGIAMHNYAFMGLGIIYVLFGMFKK